MFTVAKRESTAETSGRVLSGHDPEPCEEKEWKGKEERGKPGQHPGGQRYTMSGVYREEHLGEGQPSPWAGEVRVEDIAYKPYLVTGRVEGC